MAYDPSDVGVKGSVFGYPYQEAESELIILPLPWDVTVSYGSGTSMGPQAVLAASSQLDLEIPGVEKPWEYKVFMKPVDEEIMHISSKLRSKAVMIIKDLENGQKGNQMDIDEINQGSHEFNEWVYNHAKTVLEAGKACCALGGDHSTPLGLIRALAEDSTFGILQIDAHMDLRNSYEGFQYSHASIMYNALRNENITHLCQIGIRDYAPEESEFVTQNEHRIRVFYDQNLKSELFEGKNWSQKVMEIIEGLPQNVYISFDIDGLDPSLCPTTGTPVPGGLSFDQVIYLVEQLSVSGRKIIGFDLSEVCPGSNDWDANVGARILYRLCTGLAVSQGKLKRTE